MLLKKNVQNQQVAYLFTLAFCLIQLISYSQQTNWNINPFQSGFIENIGQYKTDSIQFSAQTADGVKVFFYKNKLRFVIGELPKSIDHDTPSKHDSNIEKEPGESDKKRYIYPSHNMTLNFVNPQSNTSLVGQQQTQAYHIFESQPNQKANGYQSIVYKNIYPNIDLEFHLPHQGGLKYNVIVHPNGDINQFKYYYDAINFNEIESLNDEHIVHFDSHSIKEKAPITYQNNSIIDSKFEYNGDTISFSTARYNHNQDLIIDPWIVFDTTSFLYWGITVPTFGPLPGGGVGTIYYDSSFAAYKYFDHINIDEQGYSYLTFGPNILDSVMIPANLNPPNPQIDSIPTYRLGFEVHKYDPNGTLLWTYSFTSYENNINVLAHDLTLNPVNGTSYLVTDAARVTELSTTGFAQDTSILTGTTFFNTEVWTTEYNHCDGTIYYGMGGTNDGNEFGWSDTMNTLDIIPVGVFGSPTDVFEDVPWISIDPDGNSAYFLIAKGWTGDTTELLKIDISNPTVNVTNVIWTAGTGYQLIELQPGVHNGLTSGINFLYAYDGSILKKIDKFTGATINSLSIPVSNWSAVSQQDEFVYLRGGIDVDRCGRVYIGLDSVVQVYDPTLSLISTIPVSGNYILDVKVKNNNLYVAGKGYYQNIDLLSHLNLGLVKTDDSCNLCIGTATITGCENIDSLNILWQPSGQTTQTAVNLCTGWHSVTVSGGCYTEITELIDSIYVENNALVCGITIAIEDDTICSGTCIDLIASTTGHTGTVNYQWNNGILDTDSTVNICPTATTTYQVIATDQAGEIDTAMVTITVLPPPVVDLGNDTTICDSTHILSPGIIGGTYLWQDSSTNQSFSADSTGWYWVEVNVGNCSDIDSIFLTFNTLNINIGADTTLCNGDSLILNAQNTGASFLWQDGSIAQTFIADTAGLYWVEVDDGNCIKRDSINLSILSPTSVNLGNDTILCYNDTLTLNAGNAGANYLWQDSSNLNSYQVTTPGTYWVETSTNGCSFRDTIIISYDSLFVDLGPDTTICSSSILILDAQNNGVNYLWTTGQLTKTIQVDTTGIYGVEVSNNICSDSDEKNVQFSRPITLFSVSDTVGCAPQDVDFTDLSSADTGIKSWQWQFGDGNGSTIQNPSHFYNAPGNYTVSLTVTDSLDCQSDSSRTITVQIYDKPVSKFSINPTSPGINEPVQFTDQSLNAMTWEWSFGDGHSNSIQHPTHSYVTPYTYSAFLVVENEICTDTSYHTIIIEEELLYYVPNAFTPDGNNFNQTFRPVFTSGFDPYDFKMLIFNRWGEIIFESKNANIGWDGVYNNSIVQNGTYIWKITFGDINNSKTHEQIGTVTVLH